MIRSIFSFVFISLFLVLPAIAGDQADVSLLWSPKGGCEKQIISAVDNAKESVLVAAYSFSSKPIAESFYRAARRGVVVRMLMDRRQPTAHYSMCDKLVQGGAIVRIDKKEPLMHMKTIIVDDYIVLTGSYNFTASAEHRNAEVLLIIISKTLATKFIKNWLHHWSHSHTHLCGQPKAPVGKKPTAKPECEKGNCPSTPSDPSNPFIFRRPRRW